MISPPEEASRYLRLATLPLAAYLQRLLITLVVLIIVAALWTLADVILLVFGAVLLAIGLCGAARLMTRLSGIRGTFALISVAVLVFSAFAAALWIFGSVASKQFNDVLIVAPAGYKLFIEWLGSSIYGQQILEQAHSINLVGATGWATALISPVFGLITRGLGYAAVCLFVATYLAAQPGRYVHLVLRLIPVAGRQTTQDLFNALQLILERWLLGQMAVMLTIGALSGLGLWFLGIEAAFALGLMGGLLCFIPFVGAILAAIPATLVALTQGPSYAGMVVLMYAFVHFIEGNFITPMVQAEATALPPALAILSTVAFGLLFGPLGVLLAAPLTLFFLVAVERLYVQNGLGEAPEEIDISEPVVSKE